MNNIKRFEPLFGEWHAEALIRGDENERVYRAYREKDGAKEYCAVRHVPVPTDESVVAALREGGMDEETLKAYADSRYREVCREIAISERLTPTGTVVPVLESAVIPREDLGWDAFIRTPLWDTLAHRQAREPLSGDEAARLASDISAGISALSKEGIVHRAIGPETIFVKPDGGFALGGLASARVAGSPDEGPSESEGLAFAAPEVVNGEPRTEKTDLYSLGLVLYAVTNGGRMPFEPEAPAPVSALQSERAAMRRMMGAKLPAPKFAGEELGSVILKACAADPAGRFASAEEMNRAASAPAGAAPAPVETPAPAVHMVSEIDDIPDMPTEDEAAPAEPEPTAKKEPVTPVIGSAAFPLREGPADKKALKRAEKERKKLEKRQRREGEALPPDREMQPEAEEPEFDEPVNAEPERKESSGKGIKAGIIIAAIVAGLALLGILFLLGKDLYEDYLLRRESAAFKPRDPEIVRDAADPDVYRVTIYEKNGTAVVYESINGIRREYSVNSDDRIVFELRGSDLIPDEPIDSTAYSVQPKFYTRNEAGELVPISNMGYIMLDLPTIEMTFDCPDVIESEDGVINIKGHVEKLNSEFFINGEPVQLTADGNFSYEHQYEENGEYEIAFEARLPKYSIAKHTVKVNVNIPEPPAIQLPWDMGETNYSQRVTDPNDTIEVHGLIPAGSTFELACDDETVILSEPEVTEEGGFTFTATLPAIGDYVVRVSCTDPNGAVNTREIHLQRAPEWKPYVESAWAMSLDALSRPSNQCYNVKGTVTEIIEHTDHYLVVLETEGGGSILLEYHHHYPTANSFEVGKQYNWIYGFPKGVNEQGAPVVYVWFVNDK